MLRLVHLMCKYGALKSIKVHVICISESVRQFVAVIVTALWSIHGILSLKDT